MVRAALIASAALAFASLPALAQTAVPGAIPGQDAVAPGTSGEAPLSRNGAGPDSGITGYSEGGGGGTGGAGGLLSNGTSDNAGTATGGRSGGNESQSGAGGGG